MIGKKTRALLVVLLTFAAIARGDGAWHDTRGQERKQFDSDFFAAYSIYGLVLEIGTVYPGSLYRDTCISEIEIETVD